MNNWHIALETLGSPKSHSKKHYRNEAATEALAFLEFSSAFFSKLFMTHRYPSRKGGSLIFITRPPENCFRGFPCPS
jgi:hypothetical protein